jgi:hypothetical protein
MSRSRPHRRIWILEHFDELEAHTPATGRAKPCRVRSRSMKVRFADHPAQEIAYRRGRDQFARYGHRESGAAGLNGCPGDNDKMIARESVRPARTARSRAGHG